MTERRQKDTLKTARATKQATAGVAWMTKGEIGSDMKLNVYDLCSAVFLKLLISCTNSENIEPLIATYLFCVIWW